MEKTDEELLSLYKEGNKEHFETIIARYIGAIYNFTKRTGAKEEADDVTQEIFLKVWKNIGKFDADKASFKTWIFTIARNTVTDFLRKKKNISFADLEGEDEDFSFSETISDENLLPDEMLQKLQDEELLKSCLDTLPLAYQGVLSLYYQEDMTFDEIGKVLGKPLNTVKSQHRRAVLELRKMLAAHDQNAPKGIFPRIKSRK